MHGLQHVNTWYKPSMNTKNDKQLQMRASDDFIRTIDDWRRVQPDIPARAEAIRRLINMGIAAEPILRDLLRLIEHLNDPELAKHAVAIKEALGE